MFSDKVIIGSAVRFIKDVNLLITFVVFNFFFWMWFSVILFLFTEKHFKIISFWKKLAFSFVVLLWVFPKFQYWFLKELGTDVTYEQYKKFIKQN